MTNVHTDRLRKLKLFHKLKLKLNKKSKQKSRSWCKHHN